jgi:LPXTG-motif cell wall-anchored protein
LVATLLLLLAIGILFTSTFHFVKDVMNPGENTFSQLGLAYLSELLFGVIILELLSTILTYIHARNLEATIKDFLIVGLISSVRKILLTGAQSSIESVDKKTGENAALIHDKAMGFAYINEAIGTVITIIGILLLIGGLLLLDRRKKLVPSSEAAE